MERRWLLRLGPPIIAAGAVAMLAAPWLNVRGQTRMEQGQPASARLQLRQLAPDVFQHAWIAERGDGTWSFGRAGDATMYSLPAGETAIAAGGHFVASTVAQAGGRTRVQLRDLETGGVKARVDLPIWVSAAAFSGDDLIVSGYGDVTAKSDGGIAIVHAAGSVETLVAPGPFPRGLGDAASHGDVFVSPDGRLAATYLCAGEVCETQVVDLVSREVLRPQHGKQGFLRALTDKSVVLTDGAFQWISAVDPRTDREIWRQKDSILMTPLAGADGSVSGLVGSERTGWAIARIDGRGHMTDLTPRSRAGAWPQIWAQVSSSRTAVIGDRDFAAALSDPAGGSAALVDVTSARMLGRDVLVLPGQSGRP